MDRYIGKLLDNRYEILEKIGSGGMADVYKARCHRLNRLVAIKILKEDLSQDAEFRRRFHAESQAVAMLSHPNIVSVYDVSRSDNIEYIVMELIEGMTLKQYMEQKGTLNWREALHFSTQICKALEHAHSRGIVHRDVKPANFLLTAADDRALRTLLGVVTGRLRPTTGTAVVLDNVLPDEAGRAAGRTSWARDAGSLTRLAAATDTSAPGVLAVHRATDLSPAVLDALDSLTAAGTAVVLGRLAGDAALPATIPARRVDVGNQLEGALR